MTALIFSNNAHAKLASAVGASDVTLPLTNGTNFPEPGDNEAFRAVMFDPTTGDYEVVQCSARSGNTLTVVRGREGTMGKAFAAGTLVSHSFTAGTILWMLQQIAGGATLALLPDVTLALPIEEGQVLTYDADEGHWTNRYPFKPVENVDNPAFVLPAAYFNRYIRLVEDGLMEMFLQTGDDWVVGMDFEMTYVGDGSVDVFSDVGITINLPDGTQVGGAVKAFSMLPGNRTMLRVVHFDPSENELEFDVIGDADI